MGLISKLLGKEKQKDTDGMWEGFSVGDVVRYKGCQFLYRGIDPNGGPGMAGIAEPTFGMPRPSVTYEFYITYYLRNQQNQPRGIPEVMLETAPPTKTGNLSYIAFLNATMTDLTKIKHISEDKWNIMIEKLQKELLKSAKKASKVITKALSERDYYMQADVDNPHLVSNPPVFGVGGCGCGCASAFQFYLDENSRVGIILPSIYESNFWHDDEQRTKQRSLENEVKKQLHSPEVVFIIGNDKKPKFLEPFLKY